MSEKMALAVLLVILCVLLNSADARHDCDCNEFGTEQTALGAPIYDGRGCECKCKPHVEGKRCDRCGPNFYNIKTRHGCEPCLCDVNGSQNQSCDAATGQCTCREGFFGYRCNGCKPFHYRKSQRQCVKCNCNIFGSNDLQCDLLGRCPCHENVEGKHCDGCARFTHSLFEFCPECPACYRKVNGSLSEFQNDLRKIRSQILAFDSTKHGNSEQFVYKLGQIRAKAAAVTDLMKNNAEKPVGTFSSELKKEGKNLGNKVKAMLSKVSGTDNLGAKIKAEEKDVRRIPGLIRFADMSLRQVASNVSQHDAAMANLARKSVKIHSNMAALFKKMLRTQGQLNDTCASVCETMAEYERVEEDLRRSLRGPNATAAMNKTVNDLKETTGQVRNVIEQCVTLNEENVRKLDGLKFPKPANFSGTKPDEEEKRKLTEELDLYGQYLGAVSDMTGQANERLKTFEKKSRDSLNEIEELDDRTDDFLQEINSLTEKYAVISEHSRTLEKSNDETKAKLKDVPEMRDKINNLVGKLKAQNESLRNSRLEVKRSHGVLNDALNAIKNMQRAIELTRANLSETETNLSKLLVDVKTTSLPSDLTTKLNDVRNWQKRVEEEAEDLSKMEKKLAQIREEMQRESEAAVEHVEKNVQALTDLTEYLNALPTTDTEFALIENELQTTEDILRLRGEIEFLKGEVAHVKKIADAMPRGEYCPKHIRIEPKNLL